jgi:hypothetical protein
MDEIKQVKDNELKKISEFLLKNIENYHQTMKYLAADAPLEILCLSKACEKALFAHGCLRVYDVFNLDFTKVKGLSAKGIRDLTTSLDKFIAMC